MKYIIARLELIEWNRINKTKKRLGLTWEGFIRRGYELMREERTIAEMTEPEEAKP